VFVEASPEGCAALNEVRSAQPLHCTKDIERKAVEVLSGALQAGAPCDEDAVLDKLETEEEMSTVFLFGPSVERCSWRESMGVWLQDASTVSIFSEDDMWQKTPAARVRPRALLLSAGGVNAGCAQAEVWFAGDGDDLEKCEVRACTVDPIPTAYSPLGTSSPVACLPTCGGFGACAESEH
jgi:hypothetical protein